jgi:predicted ABC-type ATPase
MKLFVNIRGCNGSGKSTIPIQMMNSDPDCHVLGAQHEGKYISAFTRFPKYNWFAVGPYSTKTNCGGMDALPNTAFIKSCIKYAWARPEHVIAEGILASTVKSTYADLFHQCNNEIEERKVIVLNFITPLDICLERVYARNGGKKVNVDQIQDKWNIVNKNVDYFKEQGFTSLRVDNSKTPKDKMLEKFLKFMERYMEE